MNAGSRRGEPRAVVSLHEAVAIIVGIVVGAGIFKEIFIGRSFGAHRHEELALVLG